MHEVSNKIESQPCIFSAGLHFDFELKRMYFLRSVVEGEGKETFCLPER